MIAPDLALVEAAVFVATRTSAHGLLVIEGQSAVVIPCLAHAGYVLAGEVEHQRRAFGVKNEAPAIRVAVPNGEAAAVDVEVGFICVRKAITKHYAASREERGDQFRRSWLQVGIEKQSRRRAKRIHLRMALFYAPEQVSGEIGITLGEDGNEVGQRILPVVRRIANRRRRAEAAAHVMRQQIR